MTKKGKKVLIIDDDPDFVRTTSIVLKSSGYDVVEAFSGKEGLEKAKSDKPDLYIIDLMMETYTEGTAVAKALNENEETREKPKIMITSVDLKGPWKSQPTEEEMSFEVILQKPVSPADLLKTIERSLGPVRKC